GHCPGDRQSSRRLQTERPRPLGRGPARGYGGGDAAGRFTDGDTCLVCGAAGVLVALSSHLAPARTGSGRRLRKPRLIGNKLKGLGRSDTSRDTRHTVLAIIPAKIPVFSKAPTYHSSLRRTTSWP